MIVLIIIFAVRIRKHKKAKKNNAILEELAVKYKLGEKGTDYDIDNFDDSPEKPDKRSKKKQKYAEEVEEEPALSGRRYAPEPIIEIWKNRKKLQVSIQTLVMTRMTPRKRN